ncbi:MAG: enoyl-CoA hydratase/isomerase family protein [Pyrinomonadaceae bacterium]
MSELLIENKDSILFLTLNRPEKRNALNEVLISELNSALNSVDENICAVVIRGAGKDFCSGADLSALQKIANMGAFENLKDAESLLRLFVTIRSLEVPVVAAVHGRALAGGCGLATACDIVLASESARFGYPEVKIGFVPAMVMAILRRNVSEKIAFEIITRGDEFSAEFAWKSGLINHIYADAEFDESVLQFVNAYRKLSRSAVVLSKKLFYQMDGMAFETALQTGAEVNAIARLTEDCQSGIRKFLKR